MALFYIVMNSEDTLELIYKKFDLATAKTRRALFVSHMKDLEEKDHLCKGCSGSCCSFSSNSMQVDPIQALELYHYLVVKKILDDQMIQSIKTCIKKYRLDHELSTGRGEALRKTYTCPFYLEKEFGCLIDPNFKPYGCLGFNPDPLNFNQEVTCKSNLILLQKVDDEFFQNEEKANCYLREKFHITWTKQSIPMAMLELHQIFTT